MRKQESVAKIIKTFRWIARIISILVLILAIGILLTPGTEVEGQTPTVAYWILLIMWCTGVLGLLLAWRWELVGAIIAIFALITRDMFYYSLSRQSFVDFGMVWLPILIPALLFLLAWWLEKRAREKLCEQNS
jgi:hypothetical protein